MSRELLINLKQILGYGKKNWPCGRAKGTVRVYGDVTKKAKAYLELSLARDMKDNKKGFYKYISSKRKIWENVGLLLNQMRVLVTEDTEKVQLLNVSVFSAEVGNPRLWKYEKKAGERETFS